MKLARFWSLFKVGPVPLSLGMAMIVFAIDLCTPLGVASGIPYVLGVLVALNAPRRGYVQGYAGLCSALTIFDLFVGADRGDTEMWKVLTNRTLTILMIWVTVILGLMRKRAQQQHELAEEMIRLHLADLAHLGRLQTAGQLATTLAHELNQPLAAISLQSEIATHLVQSNGDAGAEALKTALGEVTEQAQRAGQILRSLRNLVQKGDPVRKPVEINQLVRDVVRLVEVGARRAKISIVLQLEEGDLVIKADPIQIEQVLFNLLQNAIQAMDPVAPAIITGVPEHLPEVPSGSASFTGLRKDPRLIQVRTVRADGRVLISVRDSGMGFGPDDAERLFARFFSTKKNGLGMGLAISRAIVEAHGGRLTGAPSVDRGATFTITLPNMETT